jgi:hypothetical protein
MLLRFVVTGAGPIHRAPGRYTERLAALGIAAADGLSRARMLAFGIAISKVYADYWHSLTSPPGNP